MRKLSEIRIIGNEVLHRVPKPVDWNSSEHVAQLKKDIPLMKTLLRESMGVGISSNQCAPIKDPLQIILVGTDDEACIALAKKNYPNREIPPVTVMINPRITQLSGEIFYPEFGESCLSVKGAVRGQVPRFTALEMEFDDEEGLHHHRKFSGFIAHIIQHECDHQLGIVFLQKILQELSTEQAASLKKIIQFAIENPSDENVSDGISNPLVLFSDRGNGIHFEEANAKKILASTPKDVLEGIQNIIEI
jgi:peptide deformylase